MTLSRRQLLLGGAGLMMAAPLTGVPMTGAWAQDAGYASGEMTMGAEDAPITIIEYASMTCPHCANFHHNTWPDLKKHWIDTGKVRFIFREFPFDEPGLAAAMLARCGGEQRFFAFIDILFKQQPRWSRSRDPMGALRNIGALGGVTGAQFDACMANGELQKLVLESRLVGHRDLGVNATPTLIINDEKYEGSHSYDALNAFLLGI